FLLFPDGVGLSAGIWSDCFCIASCVLQNEPDFYLYISQRALGDKHLQNRSIFLYPFACSRCFVSVVYCSLCFAVVYFSGLGCSFLANGFNIYSAHISIHF